MQDALVFAASLLIVALLTWFAARKVTSALTAARAREAEVRLEEARARLERDRQAHLADRARDEERFKAIAMDVTAQSNAQFLELATTKLETPAMVEKAARPIVVNAGAEEA